MKHDLQRSWSRIILSLMLLLVLPRTSEGGEAATFPKPEKDHLEIAIAAWSSSSLPLLIAKDAGYFANHGLSVSINQVSASAAMQGVVSGKIDIYHGGAAAIAARLAGADVIYIAANVDRSSLMLFGQKNITSFEALRGKSIATTSPGAFGEIAVRKSAKRYGIEIGKDIKLLYHRSTPEALSTFLVGNASGLVITPPQTEMAKEKGYPVIIDYYKEGLKIIGPGTAVTREFAQRYPNTIKAYLIAYLEGLKRAIADEKFANQINAKYARISDSKILAENYQQGLRVWNKDMTVDPVAIEVVLENSSDPKAKSAEVKQFYDNSLIAAVNHEYASRLFPGEVK
ncbi:MAG TPA: ABC transporter substrate-binding protein [Terriglobales bacterium]|nr:ABC transporter substrate-binding protein [Terriglobales bacterium]